MKRILSFICFTAIAFLSGCFDSGENTLALFEDTAMSVSGNSSLYIEHATLSYIDEDYGDIFDGSAANFRYYIVDVSKNDGQLIAYDPTKSLEDSDPEFGHNKIGNTLQGPLWGGSHWEWYRANRRQAHSFITPKHLFRPDVPGAAVWPADVKTIKLQIYESDESVNVHDRVFEAIIDRDDFAGNSSVTFSSMGYSDMEVTLSLYSSEPYLIPAFGDGRADCRYSSGDANGDGLDDIFYVTDNGEVHVRRNTGSGFASDFAHIAFGGGDSARYAYGDVNGDGKTDVFYVTTDGQVHVRRSTGSGFTWDVAHIALGNGDPARYGYGDVNGDGKTDIFYVTTQGQVHVRRSTGFAFVADVPHIGFGNGDPSRYFYADLDGDGKTDVFHISTSCQVWVARGKGLSISWDVPVIGFGNGDPARYAIGDVNGDGMADVFHIPASGQVWVIRSYGSGLSWDVPVISFGSGTASRYKFADLNGNGFTDVIYIAENGDVHSRLSSGADISNASCPQYRFGDGNPGRYRFININGDNSADLFYIGTHANDSNHTAKLRASNGLSWLPLQITK